MQIFQALESIHKRTDLLHKLASTLITKKSLIAELKDDLVPQIKKAGCRRNDLVHAYWGINDEEYPDAVLLIKTPGKFMVYKESDFNEVLDLIIATDKAVCKFEDKVRKHLRWKKRPFREEIPTN